MTRLKEERTPRSCLLTKMPLRPTSSPGLSGRAVRRAQRSNWPSMARLSKWFELGCGIDVHRFGIGKIDKIVNTSDESLS